MYILKKTSSYRYFQIFLFQLPPKFYLINKFPVLLGFFRGKNALLIFLYNVKIMPPWKSDF